MMILTGRKLLLNTLMVFVIRIVHLKTAYNIKMIAFLEFEKPFDDSIVRVTFDIY